MRRFRIALLLLAAVIIGAFALRGMRGQVTILMYHHLVPDGGETNSLTVTEGKFRRDMEYLREHGYQTLLPDELNEILRGTQKCPKKAVVISFDDGYQSNYSIAYPVLKENGLRAVIALITANIREEKEENAFMLCWPEVREMSDSGLVSFGSHSHNLHNPDIGGAVRKGPDAVNGVQRLPDEKQVQYAERVGMDIAHSCTMIEQYTGVPVHWFAYPYGAGDRWCEKLLDAMDVTVSVSTQPGIARVGHGMRDLPRYGIREDTDLSDILPS